MLKQDYTRRHVLGAAVTVGAIAAAAPSLSFAQDNAPKAETLSYPYKLPDLGYSTSALAPIIDKETMELHHGKHHKAYVDNLNNALKDHSDLQKLSLDALLSRISSIPESARNAVRNNGGGHANHAMFWQVMNAPDKVKEAGTLVDLITKGFGSLDDFKKQFDEAGTKRFGSGWVFLTADKNGKLEIESLPNQDTPLMSGKRVIFGNDVWEHAYYVTYRNRRADYLKEWWKVLDWAKADERYAAIRNGAVII